MNPLLGGRSLHSHLRATFTARKSPVSSSLHHVSRRFRMDHKYAAQGGRKPTQHRYFIAMGALSAAAGVLAGSFAPFDEKSVPSPFLLPDIQAELQKNFEFNPDLAAGMILLAYSYCIGQITGQPLPTAGHPVWHTCQDIIDSLTKVHVIQYGDAVTLAGVHAIKFLGGPEIHWKYGRKNVKVIEGTKGPNRSSSLTETLAFFDSIGFSAEEAVALMACHGVGRTQETAYPLQWKERKFKLDNVYYQNLIQNVYHKPSYDLQGFFVLRGQNKSNLAALPYELEMVKAKETHDIVQGFAKDTDVWEKAFTTAFSKLIQLPWMESDLREYVELNNAEKIRRYNDDKRKAQSA